MLQVHLHRTYIFIHIHKIYLNKHLPVCFTFSIAYHLLIMHHQNTYSKILIVKWWKCTMKYGHIVSFNTASQHRNTYICPILHEWTSSWETKRVYWILRWFHWYSTQPSKEDGLWASIAFCRSIWCKVLLQ